MRLSSMIGVTTVTLCFTCLNLGSAIADGGIINHWVHLRDSGPNVRVQTDFRSREVGEIAIENPCAAPTVRGLRTL